MASEGQRVFVIDTTVILILAALFYFGIIIYWMWQDDEVKLFTLRRMITGCQHVARFFGSVALDLEQGYNEYVAILH